MYKTHIKDKPIVSSQKNTTNEELEIYDNLNNEELDEDNINNCFTLTQSKNEDGLTFTECANESRVYINIFIWIRIWQMPNFCQIMIWIV